MRERERERVSVCMCEREKEREKRERGRDGKTLNGIYDSFQKTILMPSPNSISCSEDF